MKIFVICNKSPFPAADGGSIAMGSMVRSMALNGYDVTALNMVTYKHPATANDWPEELRNKINLRFANVDLRLRPVHAFINLFSSRSYHAERFFSQEFADQLVSILRSEAPDIIHMETIFPMVYYDVIRKYSKAKIILRPHNIEHEVWETTANAEQSPLKKWYLSLLANRLKTFELDAFQKADGIVTISSADHSTVRKFQPASPMVNIPLGVDLPRYPASTSVNTPPVLFHVGAMDWIPNQQAMSWFLETAWKTLREKYPQIQFFIAGRKMPEKFFRIDDKQLHVQGEIESPVRFMQDKDIMVVPILSGSGIRVKILEGMALGKTVVTTTMGAAGIDCTDGKNILIANTPAEFMGAISRCMDNPATCKTIGENARKLIEEKYALAVTSAQLDTFLAKFR